MMEEVLVLCEYKDSRQQLTVLPTAVIAKEFEVWLYSTHGEMFDI